MLLSLMTVIFGLSILQPIKVQMASPFSSQKHQLQFFLNRLPGVHDFVLSAIDFWWFTGVDVVDDERHIFRVHTQALPFGKHLHRLQSWNFKSFLNFLEFDFFFKFEKRPRTGHFQFLPLSSKNWKCSGLASDTPPNSPQKNHAINLAKSYFSLYRPSILFHLVHKFEPQ